MRIVSAHYNYHGEWRPFGFGAWANGKIQAWIRGYSTRNKQTNERTGATLDRWCETTLYVAAGAGSVRSRPQHAHIETVEYLSRKCSTVHILFTLIIRCGVCTWIKRDFDILCGCGRIYNVYFHYTIITVIVESTLLQKSNVQHFTGWTFGAFTIATTINACEQARQASEACRTCCDNFAEKKIKVSFAIHAVTRQKEHIFPCGASAQSCDYCEYYYFLSWI